MNNEYTHIAMVIDRSGSMSTGWNDVIGGYAEIVKTNKKEKGKCTFTVAVFDTDYELIEDFTDIQNVEEKLKVTPRGMTALLDAIGKTINSLGEKLAALKEEDRPHRIMMYIISDGEENSSQEFTKEDIKKMIQTQESTYSWVFNYIGATVSSVTESISLGIKRSNATVYNDKNYANTFSTLGKKMVDTRSVSDDQYLATCAWSVEEKESLKS